MASLQSLFSNDYLTIDVGFRYIKILQMRKKKNNELTIVNYGIGDTPKGCITNGAIKDKNRVVSEIKRVMTDHNLSAKEAKIVISGTNIITRIMMIDKVPDEEVDKKAWEEINAYLPINFNEHSVDYKVVNTVKDEGKEKIKIFVTAVPKGIINSYIEILKNLNLKPISVDTPANSVSKFFQKEIQNKEPENWAKKQKYAKLNTNTFAVIDLGSETTIVNILNNKTPEFNRVFLIGSSNIDTSIQKGMGFEANQLDKAERFKKMYGLMEAYDSTRQQEWDCSEAIRAVLNQILKNIKTSIDFYITRCAGERLSKVYLIGGGSNLKGMKEFFESELNIPVYSIKNITIGGLEFASGLDSEKISFLVNAIGVAL